MADYKCRVCGADMLNCAKYRTTCSDECKKIYNRNNRYKYKIDLGEKNRQKYTPSSTNIRLRQIAKQCREEGITYGEWQIREEGRV